MDIWEQDRSGCCPPRSRQSIGLLNRHTRTNRLSLNVPSLLAHPCKVQCGSKPGQGDRRSRYILSGPWAGWHLAGIWLVPLHHTKQSRAGVGVPLSPRHTKAWSCKPSRACAAWRAEAMHLHLQPRVCFKFRFLPSPAWRRPPSIGCKCVGFPSLRTTGWHDRYSGSKG